MSQPGRKPNLAYGHPAIPPVVNKSLMRFTTEEHPGKIKQRPEDDLPEADLVQAAILARHIDALKNPPKNPYQHDFTRFRLDCCWTEDAARAGKVARIPDHPYLREVDWHLNRHSPLMFAKARRMLLTWVNLAHDLWLLGGGQDPAWVDRQGNQVLMYSTENRKVVIAARKLEDDNGSKDFLGRLRFMYDQFEERGCRELWPSFPTLEKANETQLTFSNRSVATAVAQGKHQLAGAGYTKVHLEEFARWEEQKESLASALQTVQGGGHLVIVTTAQAGCHAARIALDEVTQERLAA